MATGKDKRRKRRPKDKNIPDDPVQSERFMDAARQLGVTESEAAFDKALRALLTLKPKRKGGNS